MILLKINDNETIETDKVIVTVPLAILNEKVINYSPSLSDERIQALGRLGQGLMDKLVLVFD